MQLVQPYFESTLAIAERLASKPEPLQCLRLRHWLKVDATADGVCRGRECGNEQRSHVISSFLHAFSRAAALLVCQPQRPPTPTRVAAAATDADTSSHVRQYRRL